ncbi:hypothetical protein ACFQ1M_14760 [Sungkyunkwania multivorans]|uniref:Uncharacterized protein n=1 Tax=Sungkyunkwania multivorans TaxID=1173618 RepID=A0ABW3D067_9FLAO
MKKITGICMAAAMGLGIAMIDKPKEDVGLETVALDLADLQDFDVSKKSPTSLLKPTNLYPGDPRACMQRKEEMIDNGSLAKHVQTQFSILD